MYILFDLLFVATCVLTAFVCGTGHLNAAILIAGFALVIFVLQLYLHEYFEVEALRSIYEMAGPFQAELECDIANYDPPQTHVRFFKYGFVFDDDRFPLAVHSYDTLNVASHVISVDTENGKIRLICKDARKLAVVSALKEQHA